MIKLRNVIIKELLIFSKAHKKEVQKKEFQKREDEIFKLIDDKIESYKEKILKD